MNQAMELAASIAEQADETAEQRARRLEETAAEADVDADTLYDVEESLRNAVDEWLTEHPDQRDDLQAMAQQWGPFIGLDPDSAEDAVVILLARAFVERPAVAARVVSTVDDVLEDQGLYQDLGEL